MINTPVDSYSKKDESYGGRGYTTGGHGGGGGGGGGDGGARPRRPMGHIQHSLSDFFLLHIASFDLYGCVYVCLCVTRYKISQLSH